MVRRLPIGFSPGQKRLAIDSLITITDGRSAMSAALKPRPCNSGMRMVSMKPGSTTRTATSGCSDIGSAGCPSTAIGWVEPPFPRGKESIAPADATPGKPRTRCKSWS
jgi:hypothetical protein